MVLEKNMLINNRYRIQEQIGVGGMAIVYRAIDEKLDREVTFKVLKEDYINDEEFIKRFSTEARAAARLSNSNIVNVYDVGNDGNIHYIVMEYIDGFISPHDSTQKITLHFIFYSFKLHTSKTVTTFYFS